MTRKDGSTLSEEARNSARQLTQRVVELTRQGKLEEAVAAADKLTREHPGYGHGWYAASNLGMALKNPEAALHSIDRALATAPDRTDWHLHRSSCLIDLGLLKEAKELVNQLTGVVSAADQHASLGLLFNRLGLIDKAEVQYQRCVVLAPDESGHFYNLATAQRALGQLDKARVSLDRAIELNPKDYDAWYALSELGTHSQQSNHVQALEALIESGIETPKSQVQIFYALAKELEDIGETDKSFSYLHRGATLRRSHLNYRVERDELIMSQLRQAYSADSFAPPVKGYPDNSAIFILGLPRTGSTLLERILGNHTQVYAAGELDNFPRKMMQGVRSLGLHADRANFPDLPALSTRLNFRDLGEAYIQSVASEARDHRRFIDKLPFNFLYVGLIQLALPGAKIIHVRRDPMDTCYAIYKTLFRDAYPFSYDLHELGRYYLAYHRLMDHWKACLPGVIHEVRYEELVSNTEHTARQALRYCGLPWEAQCLKFQDSAAASTTASASQVRRSIYSSSVGKWRLFEKQLEPLVDQLTGAGIHISSSADRPDTIREE